MWVWEKWCRITYALFLSGIGAAGSPAFVGTSPWHLHWHRPESCTGKVGSPPPPSSPPAAAAPAHGQTGPKIHWSPPADHFAPAPGAARGLAPARRICPRWAAAAALCGHRPWRSARCRGARSELGAQVVARLPSWSTEGGGTVGLFPPLLSHHSLKGARRGEKKSGAERQWGHLLMVCPGLCPLSGHWTLSGPVWRSDSDG